MADHSPLATAAPPLRHDPLTRSGSTAVADAPSSPQRTRSPAARVLLGAPDAPAWARPLLWLLLLGTAVLYLYDLTNSGTANDFYAAAVKSGTESSKAWLFGSLDAGNAITVDKPPAALWLMVLSARIFGFSSFSMLLPQALMGIATVRVTYAAVKRWAGPAAGLIAGAVIALTPVAALMFRFNNPDALLTLLMTLAAYCVIRAIDSPAARSRSLRWMLLAGTAIGFAFLTKMGQALLVLPAFSLVYLLAAPARLRVRIGHLVAAFGAFLVSAGWFVALVALWPAAARPYIGGSTNNSLWELAVGYNGLGRIFSGAGNGGGMGGGAGTGNTGFGGAAGITRMFETAFGSQISWLMPAALIALIAGLWITRKAPRTDRTRAALVLWGAWLVVTALVFSFMSGTIHPYYAVALAPAIGALIGTVARVCWVRRSEHLPRITLALMIAATGTWGFYLMHRDASGWTTGLAWVMLVGGALGAVLLTISTGRLAKLAAAAVLVGSLAAASGTASFTAATITTGHTGSMPTAGPAALSSSRDGGRGALPMGTPPGGAAGASGSVSSRPSGTVPQGGPGGARGEASSNAALTALLNKTTTRWSAAVIGDQSAAGYILSTDTAVMAIGGWSGSDASPTLAQFQQYVSSGQITYFIAGGDRQGGGPGGNSASVGSEITAWVSANYTAQPVGGTTVYDLTTS